MYDVLNFDATIDFPEVVLMMPEPVWAESLFVNEKTRFINMCDFGHPIYGDAQQRSYPVRYYHAGIHSADRSG